MVIENVVYMEKRNLDCLNNDLLSSVEGGILRAVSLFDRDKTAAIREFQGVLREYERIAPNYSIEKERCMDRMAEFWFESKTTKDQTAPVLEKVYEKFSDLLSNYVDELNRCKTSLIKNYLLLTKDQDTLQARCRVLSAKDSIKRLRNLVEKTEESFESYSRP